eukprot:NODE_3223_length_1020_cov_1864.507724_g2964_i0.p3 GENE.NODE_3223_length_1020_cov_1864.507724_g2964_i0~~NODE_3223_length_1020_cov_1864.507724_g2964_i0.p3  ORF type:complete len:112 (+),score=45.76 NODE_3223_length_1020_cov_1864.507724_g2964_i0:569-904(+)
MKHIAAYLLLNLAGASTPSKADLEKVIKAGGVEPDDAQLDSLIAAIAGGDVNELIAQGLTKIGSVSFGGGGGGSAASAPAAGAAAAAPEKKEEKKVEEEEEDDDMGFGLFD